MKAAFKAILAVEFVTVTLLLALCVPAHIVFQEKYQLFLWTREYFLELVAVPGGFADWLGRFLTQFFISPWAGAAIIAALAVAFQWLTLGFIRDVRLWQFSLTLLPVAVLAAFYANENAMLSAAVALVLSCLAARCVSTVSRRGLRTAAVIAAVPVLYMAAGPLCLVFLVALSVSDRKAAALGLPLLILTVFAVSRFFQYPLVSMFGGIHYYRFLQTVRPEPWYALAAASFPLVLSTSIQGRGGRFINAAVSVLTVAVSFFLLRPHLDLSRSPQKEETLHYALMAMDDDWDGIIEAAGREAPSRSPVSVACLNLAMAHNGMLQDRMFQAFQNGPQGLISDKKTDFISPLAMAQVYWAVGLVDSAQRLVYEAQESIPDFQKSAFCYQWLVRTNLANGDRAVADKYMDALGHTLFYRGWRPSDDLEAISRRRLDDPGLVVSDDNIRDVLSCLVRKDSTNTIASDYLLAYDMLALDLDSFVSDYQLVHSFSDPVSPLYGDALALAWARDHVNFDGMPWALPEGTAERCAAFFSDRGANRPKNVMKSRYGTSFWYYYFYHGKR